MSFYPVLIRHQGHDYHDYTLTVGPGVDVRLTEQQLLSLREQIDQDQKPISDEDTDALRAALAEIRAKPVPYPPNTMCACGDLIHPDMPSVVVEADGVLWHGNADGGGHRADVEVTP